MENLYKFVTVRAKKTYCGIARKRIGMLSFFVLVASILLHTSCSGYEAEPPKYEKTSDYLIPQSEKPTEQEKEVVYAIVREYLDQFE